MKFIFVIFLSIIAFSSCKQNLKTYDATGSFEAVERIISAEANGRIIRLAIEEGQEVESGDTIGEIDVTLLKLQAEQIKSSIQALNSKTNDPAAQVNIYEAQLIAHQSQTDALAEQIILLEAEIERFSNLVEAKATPQKQLDDLKGQKAVLEKQYAAANNQALVIQRQIDAARQNVSIQNRAILSEKTPNQKRLDIVQQQIQDGLIVNTHKGTILAKYAYDGEFTAMGKPLYKIADLSSIILKVFITADQLALVKLNDPITISTDDGSGGMRENEGKITWISSQAEFTPKTIQTKDERANLVYAIKIMVPNDGTYKIGMYGEVKFQENV